MAKATKRAEARPEKPATKIAGKGSERGAAKAARKASAKGAAKPAAPAEAPEKMSRKVYEKELRKLQVELCYLQEWAKATGARIILLFEGRDTAGKGGIIKAITERVSARQFRVVALPAPSEREKTQMFMQRYVAHFPAAGEIVILDRSWYNRAGVEHVMGLCTPEQHRQFLAGCPAAEHWIVQSGIILIKMWLEVGMAEQDRRFRARITDPLRQWKLSPMDLQSYSKWYDYSLARDEMFEATDREHAPWHVLRSDDKKRARLNGIAHILSLVPYERIKREEAVLPKRGHKHRYDDHGSIADRRFVPERF